MRKIISTILVCSALFLGGCANNQYSEYLNTTAQIEIAQANAQSERYKAMARIAESGDTTSKVAAMMALQNQNNVGTPNRNISAPKSTEEVIRSWAGILMPGLVQIHASNNNRSIAETNSNNNRLISISNSENSRLMNEAMIDGFVGVSGQIQAPGGTYYTDSYNQYDGSYNTATDSYNDNSDNSNNSDNSPLVPSEIF